MIKVRDDCKNNEEAIVLAGAGLLDIAETEAPIGRSVPGLISVQVNPDNIMVSGQVQGKECTG